MLQMDYDQAQIAKTASKIKVRRVLQPAGCPPSAPVRVLCRQTSGCPAQFVTTRESAFSIAAITRGSVGSISEGKLAAIMPSRPIRYLWKFQRGRSSGRWADAQR